MKSLILFGTALGILIFVWHLLEQFQAPVYRGTIRSKDHSCIFLLKASSCRKKVRNLIRTAQQEIIQLLRPFYARNQNQGGG